MSDDFIIHPIMPLSTKVFVCADCGAVSLSPSDICRVQGKISKADWCGTKSDTAPQQCKNRLYLHRFSCNRCSRVSVNPEVLCEPVKMDKIK